MRITIFILILLGLSIIIYSISICIIWFIKRRNIETLKATFFWYFIDRGTRTWPWEYFELRLGLVAITILITLSLFIYKLIM